MIGGGHAMQKFIINGSCTIIFLCAQIHELNNIVLIAKEF